MAASDDDDTDDETASQQELEENPNHGGAGRKSNGDVLYTPLSIEEGREDEPRPSHRLHRSRTACWSGRCCIAVACATIIVLVLAVLRFVPSIYWKQWLPHKTRSSTIPLCPLHNSTYPHLVPIHPTQLDLNRNIRTLQERNNLHGAHDGFIWDEEDENTNNWRPQGITVASFSTTDNHDVMNRSYISFVLVSWYGRADQDYDNRGARISFVDMELKRYTHVLLVDENLCTMPGLHAGGLVIINNKLHVPDSRHKGQLVRVFDVLKSLHEVHPDSRDNFFHYSYVLVQEAVYDVATVPSFLSYDWDLDMVVVGTYSHCGSALKRHTDSDECRLRPENKLAWYAVEAGGNNDGTAWMCAPIFSEMQGAASVSIGTTKMLWVVSSYGPYFDSHLHVVSGFDPLVSCSRDKWDNQTRIGDYKVLAYPPGLEDLHIERHDNRQDMWMLTEFGSRMVFVTDLEKLLP